MACSTQRRPCDPSTPHRVTHTDRDAQPSLRTSCGRRRPSCHAHGVFTRPDAVSDEDVARALIEGWDIEVTELDYLPVGFGSHHWRAVTDASEWFVTVDDLAAKRREPADTLALTRQRLRAALATVCELSDAGFDFAVAPTRTTTGGVDLAFGHRWVIAVYPHVSGRTHSYGNYTDPGHRSAVVRCLAELHGSPTRCRRFALVDTLAIQRRAGIRRCLRAARNGMGLRSVRRIVSAPPAAAHRRRRAGVPFIRPAGSRRRHSTRSVRADPRRAPSREHDRDRAGRRARRLGHCADRPARARPLGRGR